MEPIIMLDTRTPITKGENKDRYHVKIKLSIPAVKNGEKVWQPARALTGVYATENEFKSIMGTPRSKDLQIKKEKLKPLFRKAEDLAKIPGLTKKQYLTLMKSGGNFDSVTGVFDWYIEKMTATRRINGKEVKNDRFGNAYALNAAKKSFVEFKGSEHIAFAEVTTEWLNEFKEWHKNKGNQLTTVYIHCRAMRTILNRAHNPLNKITKESIPFGSGEGKFKIPSSKKGNRKISFDLSTAELIKQKNKIINHTSDDPHVDRHLAYWKALYFSNGCNPADLCRFKKRDYKNDLIKFVRKKTENTESLPETIVVFVGKHLKQLITKYGNKTLDPDDYLFPILNKSMDAEEQWHAVKKFLWVMRNALEKAEQEMNLKIPLRSSTARYLMAAILKRKGVDISAISDMLGHESESTTEIYTGEIDIDLQKMITKMLAT